MSHSQRIESRRRRTRTAIVALAAVLTLLYGALTWLVESGRTTAMDLTVSRFVLGHAPGWLTQGAGLLTNLGSAPVSVALTAVAAAVLWRGQRREALLALLVTLEHPVNALLKAILERPRPNSLVLHTQIPLQKAAGWAFPSGHAMTAVAVCGCFAVLALRRIHSPACRQATIAGAALVIIAIGASRVVLGVHWTSDVLGGYVAGAIFLLLWTLLYQRLAPRLRHEASTSATSLADCDEKTSP